MVDCLSVQRYPHEEYTNLFTFKSGAIFITFVSFVVACQKWFVGNNVSPDSRFITFTTVDKFFNNMEREKP
ncbi:hypothetical protein CFP56_040058, partial [Quercus suber]